MGNTSRAVLLIAALVVAIGLIEYGPTTALAQTQRCKRPNFLKLIAKCGPFVRKAKPVNGAPTPPSPCCRFMRELDIPCACSYVTKPMEKIVSLAKALQVARTCGAYVKPGIKCGSYKVPPHA